MVTSVHQLDDGAWVSVNDSREVNVSDLWLLARSGVCDCEPTDFLAEGFVAVSVDCGVVEGRIAGRCIACGTSGVTDWLELGRADPETGAFRRVVPDSAHVPERRVRLASPAADRPE
ncbi:hypothetical protein [Halorarius halobius]|uniref:hypothetical protein n=1 Tax=Halorarius halobius TaxID=2962671 RepID=UPI0020CD148C|nr:hypothetical protein [Halorarius halobius]